MSDLPPDQIRAYLEAVRGFLRNRVDFNYEFDEIPLEPKARALWYWSLLLGVLTHDVSGSILTLSLAGQNLRAIAILNRSLFEYWTRLRFYWGKPADALTDLNKAKGRFRVIAEAFPAEYADVPLDSAAFEAAFEGVVPDRSPRRSLKSMVRVVIGDDPEALKATYNYYYGLASMLPHGNEAIFVDLSRDSDLELPTPSQDSLDWGSRRFKEADLLGVAASFTSYTLRWTEIISGRGAAFHVLKDRFPRAVREVFG